MIGNSDGEGGRCEEGEALITDRLYAPPADLGSWAKAGQVAC